METEMTSTAVKIEKIAQSEQIDQSGQTVQTDQNDTNTDETSRVGEYHSVLAMEAARKMRRTRQKLRTGQQVCHHLKMMLASEPVTVEPISSIGSVKPVSIYPNGQTPRPLHPEPQINLL